MDQTFERHADEANKVLQSAANAAHNGAAQALPSTDKLFESFKALIADGEEVMNSLRGVSTEGMQVVRDRFSQRLSSAKEAYGNAESTMRAKVGDVGQTADRYVSDNPWRAVAMAAAAGALIAFLMQRSSPRD